MRFKDVHCYTREHIPKEGRRPAGVATYETPEEIRDLEDRIQEEPTTQIQCIALKTHQGGVKLDEPLRLETVFNPIGMVEFWFERCKERYDKIFKGVKFITTVPKVAESELVLKALLQKVREMEAETQELKERVARYEAGAVPAGSEAPEAEVPNAEVGASFATSLGNLTKAELVTKAKADYGLTLDPRLKKDALIAALQAAMMGGG